MSWEIILSSFLLFYGYCWGICEVFSSEYFSFLRKNKVEGKRGFSLRHACWILGSTTFLLLLFFIFFVMGLCLIYSSTFGRMFPIWKWFFWCVFLETYYFVVMMFNNSDGYGMVVEVTNIELLAVRLKQVTKRCWECLCVDAIWCDKLVQLSFVVNAMMLLLWYWNIKW